jgi:hypothetical protein
MLTPPPSRTAALLHPGPLLELEADTITVTKRETGKVIVKIHGVSQSSGTERQLTIARGVEGVVLTILNHPRAS